MYSLSIFYLQEHVSLVLDESGNDAIFHRALSTDNKFTTYIRLTISIAVSKYESVVSVRLCVSHLSLVFCTKRSGSYTRTRRCDAIYDNHLSKYIHRRRRGSGSVSWRHLMSSFACIPLTDCILCDRYHHGLFYCLAPLPARDMCGTRAKGLISLVKNLKRSVQRRAHQV